MDNRPNFLLTKTKRWNSHQHKREKGFPGPDKPAPGAGEKMRRGVSLFYSVSRQGPPPPGKPPQPYFWVRQARCRRKVVGDIFSRLAASRMLPHL